MASADRGIILEEQEFLCGTFRWTEEVHGMDDDGRFDYVKELGGLR